MFDSCLSMFYCIRWLYLHVHLHFSYSSSSLLFIILLRSILFCYIYAHLGPFPIHTFCIRQTTQHKLHSTHMLPKREGAKSKRQQQGVRVFRRACRSFLFSHIFLTAKSCDFQIFPGLIKLSL